ncbi:MULTISPECIES: 50S ribosomal protein L24 [unclassified Wenzhouxiangella]|uniref:50S ribosomal protein L24 n=1 Tax=unclassified Wenzhouxiangella TaxID=2613841 RepID=UPI000E32A3DB|nr:MULTISPECIES: 50S ribosomal protein L24 [unclassified Wenzhouxiangella]RFF26464.1 50S ribosomal protein L24 [Wenzhouxiangella sp. 15181]RFP67263.1 50S ribosomal protein L24 [Wenzhouxiangella sp. 15190]
MERIRKGDEVIVTTGRSKGQRGHVLKVLKDQRFLVENVNMVKRHQKPDPQSQKPGGIIEREAPIDASNVMLFNPATGKGDRVGFKFLEDGRKVRFYRSTGEVVDI